MESDTEPEVFFSDGVVVDIDKIAVSAGFTEEPDADVSRIYIKLGDEWLSHEVSDDFIVSIDYYRGQLYAAGLNGLIKYVGKLNTEFTEENIIGKFKDFLITDASDRGHLSRIRSIGDVFYVCGWAGQVYRLSDGSWSKVENGIDYSKKNSLQDINGTSEGDIYTAGLNGTLLHYNGKKWEYLDSPTNNHFYSIICVGENDVLLCGSEGGFYRGNRTGWKYIGNESNTENFWSMQKFGDLIYIAYGDSGLLEYDGSNFSEVDFGLNYRPLTHRLSSGSKKLLSTGSADLILYNKKKWKVIVCPDNQ